MHNLSTLSTILAHSFIGDFASDHEAIAMIYEFIENESNTISDRASAMRYLAVQAFGLDGEDAGENVPDSDFLYTYMSNR